MAVVVAKVDRTTGQLASSSRHQHEPAACFGKPDPVDMKVYCPEGEETFNDDETTEEAPT